MSESFAKCRKELYHALAELFRIIHDEDMRFDHPDRYAAKLTTATETVDALGQKLGKDTPPELKHFLERRSYSKALAFLDTGYLEPGPGKKRHI